jgi:hypothetical protein
VLQCDESFESHWEILLVQIHHTAWHLLYLLAWKRERECGWWLRRRREGVWVVMNEEVRVSEGKGVIGEEKEEGVEEIKR